MPHNDFAALRCCRAVAAWARAIGRPRPIRSRGVSSGRGCSERRRLRAIIALTISESGLGDDFETHCNPMQRVLPKPFSKHLILLETCDPLGSASKYNGLERRC